MKKTVAISVEPRCFSDDEVPEGWKLVTILNACEVNPPKPPRDFLPADAPVTFVPMPAVDADMGAITNPEIKPYLEVRNGFTSFRDGDVIMAKITPCMENGKAAIVRGMKNGIGFGSTEFHVMRSRGEILPEYLFYYIRQKSFRNEAESHFTGSVGQKRVPTDFIKQSVIPLPPLAEQRRIVARIEALLSHVDAAGDRLSRVPLIMKRFRQAVLAAACSGRLTEEWREDKDNFEDPKLLLQDIQNYRLQHGINKIKIDSKVNITENPIEIPNTWIWSTIEKIADISGGIQKQPMRAPQRNFYPYLRVANVLRGSLDLHEIKNMELFAGELERYHLELNDILIVEGNGSFSEIGRSAIWNGEIENCVHQNHIIRVRVRKFLPQYVNLYWNSPLGSELSSGAAVTTSGLYTLSTKKIAQLPIPLPPISEQHEIVRRVGLLFERADAIEREVVAAGRRCERLTQAVMIKAFSGRL
ncbi:restriction endonuclease subunit S [Methanosphaerula palustris]|uniref:Restriction modification system DNA specificity domain protein n=1 Tax=Methanosphaerula palustris (strain ATCC BAA-1556 / DSM 19958 / E1-9c) TaxID=521011 RepID=B8GGK0_METPE|nr:restriction endonuclease subunit S [Methanosphaerula palustris]ACL16255.1 restriction modification system DNA specificity domain protein [Methanosphaerula palustris E1-9c]